MTSLLRFWKNISQFESKSASTQMYSGGSAELVTQKDFLTSFVSSLVEILLHSNFKKCGINKGNYLPHFLIFYGFVALFVTCFGAPIYSLTGAGLPLPLTNPLKILGIMGDLTLFVDLTLVIYSRLFRKGETAKATYYDWFFIALLYRILAMTYVKQIGREIATGVSVGKGI